MTDRVDKTSDPIVGAQAVFTIAKAIYTNRWHDDPPWEFAAESAQETCRANARAAVAALGAAGLKIVPADPIQSRLLR